MPLLKALQFGPFGAKVPTNDLNTPVIGPASSLDLISYCLPLYLLLHPFTVLQIHLLFSNIQDNVSALGLPTDSPQSGKATATC